MSISSLIAAIHALASEKSPSMINARVHTVTAGIKEIGDRLAELERRMDAIERKLKS